MKCMLDTSVYIGAMRSAKERAKFSVSFTPLIPSTYLAAVVAYELYVNAQDRPTRRLVEEFVAPMERTNRVITPTFADWLSVARIISGILESDRSWKSKLPALVNDGLIALCARRIGARLFTRNEKDFRLIQRHLDFSWVAVG
jgi:predicted nucleic acid-binding protein